MKKIFLCFILFFTIPLGYCQQIIGLNGLLNTPSAFMKADGTFMVGANYLPREVSAKVFDYNTINYYLDLTFLPFLEVNYKMTLFQMEEGKYTNQDRSFAVRLQLLKEKKYRPALLIGGNDILTTNKANTNKIISTSNSGNQYFGNVYVVLSKNIPIRKSKFITNLGYYSDLFSKGQSKGVFGAIGFAPGFYSDMNIILEYDSRVWNIGSTAVLFKHLSLTVFLYEFRYLTGGLAYQFVIPH
ncbi:MAG: YjbH domain-containing protein [Bacteroidales bacterium]